MSAQCSEVFPVDPSLPMPKSEAASAFVQHSLKGTVRLPKYAPPRDSGGVALALSPRAERPTAASPVVNVTPSKFFRVDASLPMPESEAASAYVQHSLKGTVRSRHGRGWQPSRPATAPANALERSRHGRGWQTSRPASAQADVLERSRHGRGWQTSRPATAPVGALEKEADVSKRDPRIKWAHPGLSKKKPLAGPADPIHGFVNLYDLNELKALRAPHTAVVNVLAAVRCLTAPRGTDLTKLDLSWAGSKKALANKVGFLGQLRGVDKERIPAAALKKVREFTGPPNRPNPEFTVEFLKSKSLAAAGLCDWVVAICNAQQ